MAKKFKQYTVNISMTIKNILLILYHSINIVKHYY